MSDGDLADTAWRLASSRRWFPKDSGSRMLRLERGPATAAPGGVLTSWFLHVSHTGSNDEVWHLPVYERGGGFVDACDEPEALRVVLDRLEPGGQEFQLLRPVPAVGPPRVHDGEQSNSTVFFGDVLLKVFRRIEEGGNLDAELHLALAGTQMVAELHGIWRLGDRVLGIVLEALPDPLDGFALAREHASGALDFTGHARELGSSLRSLHVALAERLPTSRAPVSRLRDRLEAEFLAHAGQVAELRAATPLMREHLERLGDGWFGTQRIHGDAHLGQVLLTARGWRWVDFEGEPLRPLAERSLPDSPLRDVAGMLRSFAYAAADNRDHQWETDCRAAFLQGYGDLPEQQMALLAAYELHKASYEVVYEARSRPGWIWIPMRAFTNR